MIALFIAASLSASDLSAALDAEALAYFRISEKLLPQFRATGHTHRIYCSMQAEATDAAFKLKEVKLEGYLVLHSEAHQVLNDKKPVYYLKPDDQRVVDLSILNAERLAAKYKGLCENGV